MPEPLNEILNQHRIIPVVKLESDSQAAPLADALLQGGLPLAEITLRSDCALQAIKHMAGRSEFTVGAGTVLNTKQCDAAIDAGAEFIVSPGFDREVVQLCLQRNIPCIPGVATASELQAALNAGVRVVKFFPAEILGGAKAIAALAGPFHQMQFVPTGGINASNFIPYLDLPNVLAVGGSWMVSPKQIKEINFDQIASVTAHAVELVKTEGHQNRA